MVDIELDGDRVTFMVQPWQVPLALRRRVQVRLDQIVSVSAPLRREVLRPYLRLPGAYVPWLLAAGTFMGGGQREFWCVTRRERVLVVTLEGHAFTRLVVETDDPTAEALRLGKAVASTPMRGNAAPLDDRRNRHLRLDLGD